MAQTFNNELLEKIFISLTYFRTYIIYGIFPLLVLLPDLIYNFVKCLFFPDPIDVVLYNQNDYIKEITESNSPNKKAKDPFEDKSRLKSSIDEIPVIENNVVEIMDGKKLSSNEVAAVENGTTKQLESKSSQEKDMNNSNNSKRSEIERLKEDEIKKLRKSRDHKNTVTSLNENMDFGLNEGKYSYKLIERLPHNIKQQE